MKHKINCKFCGKVIGMVYNIDNKLLAVEWDSLNEIEQKILESDYRFGITYEQDKHKIHYCKERWENENKD
jgi:hypothetical protein